MENNIKLEVILFSNYPSADPRQKELLRWLTTTMQSAIEEQHEQSKKIFLSILKDTPAIYMS